MRSEEAVKCVVRPEEISVECSVDVFFLNGLGDQLLVRPALSALCAIFPDRVRLLCPRGLHEVFFSGLPFRAVTEFDYWFEDGSFCFVPSALPAADGTKGLFISLAPWEAPSLAQARRELKPVQSVGFGDNYDVAIPLDFTKHSALLAFDVPLAYRSDLRFEDYTEPPQLPSWAIESARRIFHSLAPRSLRIVIHADSKPEKMWPTASWLETIHQLLSTYDDLRIFLVGYDHPVFAATRISSRVRALYSLPLPVSLALVSMADAFVGIDSVILHSADFFRIPSVGLFGPTRAEEFGFLFSGNRTLQGAGRMDAISVDACVQAVQDLLAEALKPDTLAARS